MDQNNTQVTIQNIQAALEAILFAAGYPVSYEKLSEVLGLPVKDVCSMLEYMKGTYKERGIQLILFPDSCQLCTREEYLPYIREVLNIRRGGNLSNSSMEVLAITAYNQPVTRAYIDTVRGVDSTYAVNSLIDKGLIASVGRLDAPGRPMLYGTTDKFLLVFGMNSLADLPETESLKLLNDTQQMIPSDTPKLGEEGSADAPAGEEPAADRPAANEERDLPAEEPGDESDGSEDIEA